MSGNAYRGEERKRVVRLAAWRPRILEWGRTHVGVEKAADKEEYTQFCPFCFEEITRRKRLKDPMRYINHLDVCLWSQAWDEHRKYQGG